MPQMFGCRGLEINILHKPCQNASLVKVVILMFISEFIFKNIKLINRKEMKLKLKVLSTFLVRKCVRP